MAAPRQKMGPTGIQWQEVALGRGKYRRKTVGFGAHDKRAKSWSDGEIYIRELSIVDAGIGCAIWDAAIISSRWVMKNPDIFRGRTVIELGSGCGLTGIVAAHYAQMVYLTDYIPQLLDNLTYNVQLNSNVTSNFSSEEINCHSQKWREFMEADFSKQTNVTYLNWDEVNTDAKPDEPDLQPFLSTVPQAEIILGSELTYSTHSIHTLSDVIKKYLATGGVFYEILSDDRDGVAEFLQIIKAAGFTNTIHPVPEELLGAYNTGQRPETYHFYTFRRECDNCTFPDMK